MPDAGQRSRFNLRGQPRRSPMSDVVAQMEACIEGSFGPERTERRSFAESATTHEVATEGSVRADSACSVEFVDPLSLGLCGGRPGVETE